MPRTDHDSKPAVRLNCAKPDAIHDLLVQAEHGLNEVSSTNAVPIKSVGGFSGFQIESDFTAANRERYHRVHAVLLDGDALVHVFYVAAHPDENRESYRLVLNSITNEKG